MQKPGDIDRSRYLDRDLNRDSSRDLNKARPLADLPPGARAVVIRIEDSPDERLLPVKLAAFGIVPGAEVVLRQKRPLSVVWIGHTEVALDRRIARLIHAAPIPREGLAAHAVHKIR